MALIPPRRDIDPADEFFSPYVYVGNDPINSTDPDGREELKFNNSTGQFMGSFDDGKKEVTGAIYNYDGVEQKELVKRFVFNELDKSDSKFIEGQKLFIEDGIPSELYIDINFEDNIVKKVKRGLIEGLEADPLGIGKWVYAVISGTQFKPMDYYGSQLSKANYRFRVCGNVAYNPMDAGNFLWGAGMAKLGFAYRNVILGSQVNAILFSNSQNGWGNKLNLKGDSPADQRAITNGYYWMRKNGN